MDKAAARNDFGASQLLYKGSKVDRLIGRDPEYHYEYALTGDDDVSRSHPGHIDKKLRGQELAVGDGSFAYIEPGDWEVVQASNDPKVAQVERRADQGGKTDTTIRQGRQVLLRIHKSKYAKYRAVDAARDEFRSRGLRRTHDTENDTLAVTADGEHDAGKLLAQAGR